MNIDDPLLLRVGKDVRLPLRLLKTGSPALGVVPADVAGGVMKLTFGNGEMFDITLTAGVNWFEGAGGTGLYFVMVPGSYFAATRVGPLSWFVAPA